MSRSPVPAVGAILLDEQDRLLLVRRANEPHRGHWSLPGGRVEQGESRQAAVIREVKEETGLDVSVSRQVGSVQITLDDATEFDVTDYVCLVTGGSLLAGDDAEQVRWCTLDELEQLLTSPNLMAHLRDWGVLPR